MASTEQDKINEIPGTRYSYLEKVANVEEAKLTEILAGSKHAYLEELVSVERQDK